MSAEDEEFDTFTADGEVARVVQEEQQQQQRRRESVRSTYSGFGDDNAPNVVDIPERRASLSSIDSDDNNNESPSPAAPSQNSSPQSSQQQQQQLWIPDAVLPEKTEFYHGLIDATEAKNRLLAQDKHGFHVAGRFLLREAAMAAALSEDADEHVLSVLVSPDEVKHIRIQRGGDGVYLADGTPVGNAKTLVKVVDFLRGEGDPPLTIGVLGLKVITHDEAKALAAGKKVYGEQQQQQQEPTQQDLDDARLADNIFSSTKHVHSFASATEADGLLMDSEFGYVASGKYVVRKGGKKDKCDYLIHKIQKTPEDLETDAAECIIVHKVSALKKEKGFMVDTQEIKRYISLDELINDILTKETSWWPVALQLPVPPLTDRSKAKQIEKIQKHREKLWAKQIKAMKRQSKRKSSGGGGGGDGDQPPPVEKKSSFFRRYSRTTPSPAIPAPSPVVEVKRCPFIVNGAQCGNEVSETIGSDFCSIHRCLRPNCPNAVLLSSKIGLCQTHEEEAIKEEERRKEEERANDPKIQSEQRWKAAEENFGTVEKKPHEKPQDPEPEPEPIPEPKRYLVAGTEANQTTKPTMDAPEQEHPDVANHILPSADDGRSVDQRRFDTQKALASKPVNEQARGDPKLIGKTTAYTTDSREMQRHAQAQAEARLIVNEQARGAPELVGKQNRFSVDAAEMQRQLNAPKVEHRSSQVLVPGIVSRDKEADASWNLAPKKPGDRHEVPEAPFTLNYDEDQRSKQQQYQEPVISGPEDDKTPYFFNGIDKEEGIALLKMSGANNSFILIPDQAQTNLKFTLLFFHAGKVTGHLLVRKKVGAPFTIGCVPFALQNVELDVTVEHGPCTTLAKVVVQLQSSHSYWPYPLQTGIEAPRTEDEYGEMMNAIAEFQQEKYKSDRVVAKKSKRASEERARSPEQKTTWTVAPRALSPPANSQPQDVEESRGKANGDDEKKSSPKKKGSKKEKSEEKSAPAASGGTEPTLTTDLKQPAFNFMHTNTDKKKAERILLTFEGKKTDGRFLLRPAPKDEKNTYILSMLLKSKPAHQEIKLVDGVFIVNKKVKTSCTTLEDLITYLSKKQSKWPQPLVEGVCPPKKKSVNKKGKKKGGETQETVEESTENAAAAPLKNVPYYITVETASEENAGTDAKVVTVQLKGEHGTTDVFQLKPKRPHFKLFQPGAADEFSTELADVGVIQTLVLAHNGTPKTPGNNTDWHVLRVIVDKHVTAGSNEKYRFECDKWLNQEEGLTQEFAPEHEEEQMYDYDSDAEMDGGDSGIAVQFKKANMSVDLARQKRQNKLNSQANAVNNNVKGAPEVVGAKTNYDSSAKELRRQRNSQEVTDDYRRVNDQVRGELAGGQTAYGLDAAEMSRLVNAPKVEVKNPQELIPGLISRDKEADSKFTDRKFRNTDEELEAARGKALGE